MIMLRDRLRDHYGILGHPVTDWIVTEFCPGCALGQQMAEVRARPRWQGFTHVSRAPAQQHMPETMPLTNGSGHGTGYQQVPVSESG
jgi:hypothetical protein